MPDSDINLVFNLIFLHMEKKSHSFFFQTVDLRGREAL